MNGAAEVLSHLRMHESNISNGRRRVPPRFGATAEHRRRQHVLPRACCLAVTNTMCYMRESGASIIVYNHIHFPHSLSTGRRLMALHPRRR